MIKNSTETEYNVFFAFFKTKDDSAFEEKVFQPKKSDDLKSISKELKASFLGAKTFPSWVKVFSYGQLYPYQQLRFDLKNINEQLLPSDYLDHSIVEETKRVVNSFKTKNPEIYKTNKMFNIGLFQSTEKPLYPDKELIISNTHIVAMPFCISAEDGKLEKFFSHDEDEILWNPVSDSFVSAVKTVYNIEKDIECLGIVDSIILNDTFIDTSLLVMKSKTLLKDEVMINRFENIPEEENIFNSMILLSKDAVVYSYMTLDDYIEKNKSSFQVEDISNWLLEQDYIIEQLSSVLMNDAIGSTVNAKYLSDLKNKSDEEIVNLLEHLNPDDLYINKTVFDESKPISHLKLYYINLEEGIENETIDLQKETSDFSILVAYDEKDNVLWYETLYVLSMYGYENFNSYISEYLKKYNNLEEIIYNRIPYSDKNKKIVAPDIYKKENE